MEKQNTKSNSSKAPAFTIFKPVDAVNGDKAKWPKVGVAFRNRDGSLNLILNENVEANTRLQARSFKRGERA